MYIEFNGPHLVLPRLTDPLDTNIVVTEEPDAIFSKLTIVTEFAWTQNYIAQEQKTSQQLNIHILCLILLRFLVITEKGFILRI